jgi:HSP20 family molecular chaperone IbpA
MKKDSNKNQNLFKEKFSRMVGNNSDRIKDISIKYIEHQQQTLVSADTTAPKYSVNAVANVGEGGGGNSWASGGQGGMTNSYPFNNNPLDGLRIGDPNYDNNNIFIGDHTSDVFIGDPPNKTFNTGDFVINRSSSGDTQIKIFPRDTGLNGWRPIDNDNILPDGYFMEKPHDIPNKVDKDLINGILPYNIRKNLKADLYYDISIAGYSEDRILLQKLVNGIRVILEAKKEDDDLIGEEFEYLCKGIKDCKLEQEIYIDAEDYDLDKYSAYLENGILTIVIPKKDIKSLSYKKVTIKSDNKRKKLTNELLS